MIMPFGKHKGRPIEVIPSDYLAWLLDNVDLKPTLRRAIEFRVFGSAYREGYHVGRDEGWRQGYADGRQATPSHGFDLAAIEDVIRNWYRSASVRLHPDHAGGDTRLMTEVNALRDLLMTAIRAA